MKRNNSIFELYELIIHEKNLSFIDDFDFIDSPDINKVNPISFFSKNPVENLIFIDENRIPKSIPENHNIRKNTFTSKPKVDFIAVLKYLYKITQQTMKINSKMML